MIQTKILLLIARWGYLNKTQIAALSGKKYEAASTHIKDLVSKKLLRVDKLTHKHIYVVSSLGNRKLCKESKTIRINYNELEHQNLIVNWLTNQNDILSYQTERELKAENYGEKGYPDLIIFKENKTMLVEMERTRKTKKRFVEKLDNLRAYLKDDFHILWVVPNESMKRFVQGQINDYNWKIENHQIEIFNLDKKST